MLTCSRVPFSFLLTVQRQFTAEHPTPPDSDHALQQSFGPVLSKLMSDFNTQQSSGSGASSSQNADAIQQAQNELSQVKDIMVHNVEQILSRGERIELLVDKTDTMAGQSLAFRRGAKNARRKMFWKNQKIIALSGAVGVVCILSYIHLRIVPILISIKTGVHIFDYRAILRRWTEPMLNVYYIYPLEFRHSQ